MRQYTAAIYANDNLLLTEVLERIENDLPTIGFRLYGSSLAGTSIMTSIDEYDVHPVAEFEEEILIVLSDPQSDLEHIKKFDGSIIDLTGSFEGLLDEVYTVEDPISYILKKLNGVVNAVATVPAALFGKSGIDDLLAQTRELFAFTNTETKVFEDRLAFNMFFSDIDQGILSGYRQKLKQDTGVDVDIRMVPVSTGFVLDVYFKKDVNSNFTFAVSPDKPLATLADAVSSENITQLPSQGCRAGFAGDYIHTIVKQITDALKDITGED
jgi:hypothetical protein